MHTIQLYFLILLSCPRLLRQGAAYRATGSTDVNAASSRSHAVFSVLLKQQLADNNNKENNNTTSIDDLAIVKRIASKFHFVDLAGSERVKKKKYYTLFHMRTFILLLLLAFEKE